MFSTWILTLFLSFSFATESFTHGETPHGNTYRQVVREVSDFVKQPSYPEYRDPAEYTSWSYHRQTCHAGVEYLPIDVATPLKKVFAQMQSEVFGQSLFHMTLCFVDVMSTDIQERTIYVNEKFVTTLVRNLPEDKVEPILAVLLGHEMGHYLYEEILLESRQSALGHRRSWFDPASLETTERFLIHGEIDAIGFNLAERAGYNVEFARDVVSIVEQIIGIQAADQILAPQIPGKTERQSVIDDYLSIP
jgi:hypothetical protein